MGPPTPSPASECGTKRGGGAHSPADEGVHGGVPISDDWRKGLALCLYTDKKENQIFLIFKEIQNGAVAKSYMTNGWGNICAFPHTLGSPASYMTLQLLHSEFPYYMRKKLIFFIISVLSVQEPQGFKAKSNPIRRSLRRFNTLRGARSPSAGGSGTVLSVDGGRNILEAPSIV